MRIKKYFLPCFLPVIAVLCFVLLAPAFADMKKVDEAELAQVNASVTGASDKDSNAGAVSAGGNFDKTVRVFSPSEGKAGESFSLNLPSTGPEMTYYLHSWANNGTNQIYWGGGTTATYIRLR